jgi:hypothetical protein
MCNLKPKICGWLLEAWIEVKTMKLTIIKGSKKTCIIRAFLLAFKLVAIKANISTTLQRNNDCKRNSGGGYWC